MQPTKTLYPAPGKLVRDPVSGLTLPAQGRAIPWGPRSRERLFWLKALRDGDVLEVPPAAEATSPAPAPQPEPGPRPASIADEEE